MGTALTCEFPDPNGTGDVHQRTRRVSHSGARELTHQPSRMGPSTGRCLPRGSFTGVGQASIRCLTRGPLSRTRQ
jgi:hypothetical protein